MGHPFGGGTELPDEDEEPEDEDEEDDPEHGTVSTCPMEMRLQLEMPLAAQRASAVVPNLRFSNEIIKLKYFKIPGSNSTHVVARLNSVGAS